MSVVKGQGVDSSWVSWSHRHIARSSNSTTPQTQDILYCNVEWMLDQNQVWLYNHFPRLFEFLIPSVFIWWTIHCEKSKARAIGYISVKFKALDKLSSAHTFDVINHSLPILNDGAANFYVEYKVWLCNGNPQKQKCNLIGRLKLDWAMVSIEPLANWNHWP